MRDSHYCEECFELLLDYLEGDLGEEMKAKIDEHMKICGPCINYFQTYEKTIQLLRVLREQEATVPRSTQERIKNFVMKQTQLGNSG